MIQIQMMMVFWTEKTIFLMILIGQMMQMETELLIIKIQMMTMMGYLTKRNLSWEPILKNPTQIATESMILKK